MFYTILIISYLTYLSAAVAGLIFFNRINAEAKFLLLYLFLELIAEAYCNYLSMHNESNLWLYNVFNLFEAGTFGGILISYIPDRKFKTAGIVLSSLFFFLWIVINFIVSNISILHPTIQVTECLILVFLSGYLIIHVSNITEDFYHDPRFWIASAILIYFFTTLFVSAITSVITKPGYHGMDNLWIINSVANIFSHILFVIYFVWNSRWNSHRKMFSF